MSDDLWGAYVHVPWCRMRCPYCAFEIVPDLGKPNAATWTNGVLDDLERWRPEFCGNARTLYFGGGTPSRLDPSELAIVIDAVQAQQITTEANPEDLTDAWFRGVQAAGVTRVSVGVQTLSPHFARRLGRSGPDARGALERLAKSDLQSWSADLMFALPDQTLSDLVADLEDLLSFDPPHVSLYGLTIEPGTGFARLHDRRRLQVPDDDLWRRMYDHLVERLSAAGLNRYEVSNFAKPGHESTHNQLYWTGRPYMGLGPSAHGLAPDGRRWVNRPMGTWPCTPEIEHPTPRQASIDTILSRTRATRGLPLDALALQPDAGTVRQLVFAGLLEAHERHLVLTEAGFPVADAVIRTLVRSLDAPAGRTG